MINGFKNAILLVLSPGNMAFGIYFAFELLAFFTACFKYKRLAETPYKAFLPFLLFIVLYELGTIYDLFLINHTNVWITNVITTIEFLFYSLFMTSLLKSNATKKVMKTAIALCLAFTLADILLIDGIWALNLWALSVQTLLIIAITGCYFWELMHMPFDSSINLVKEPAFWLNIGVMFFYLAEILFYISFGFLAYKHNATYLDLTHAIVNLANAVLYSCLTVSFLCLSPSRKLSTL